MPRFNYPFANIDKYEKVHIERGFSIQKAIDTSLGIIFEIGGPTDNGFFFLRGCTLPRRPIITNKLKHGGKTDKEARKLDKKYIEETLDIRTAKLKSQSVGVCLASSLDIIANAAPAHKKARLDAAWKQLADEESLLHSQPSTVPKIGLRHTLLYKAHDFMEPGGLLILEGLREAELKYALALGFSLRAAVGAENSNKEGKFYPALVLQR